MNIQFRNVDGLISPELQARVERKLTKLSVATDSNQATATAMFDLEKAVGSSQSGQLWQASLTIESNGNRFHTSDLADSPEKASDKVISEMQTQVRKQQGKRQTLIRRGGSALKSLARRFGSS